jgi:hypothetical protein
LIFVGSIQWDRSSSIFIVLRFALQWNWTAVNTLNNRWETNGAMLGCGNEAWPFSDSGIQMLRPISQGCWKRLLQQLQNYRHQK